jgi:hypothetical protein
MTEDELNKKRQDFRDQEVMNKISQYSNSHTLEYRHQVIKTNYTYKRVDKRIGKMGFVIIGSQALFLVLFSALFVFSYIPHTKKIVTMVMP